MRWRFGPFGVKDLFTMINLLGGVGCIVLTVEGRFVAAGTALLVGYLLGDTLDGPVARLTKTSNAFGSELDTATDHFTQAIAPAVLVYAVYAQGGHRAGGIALMSLIVTCATIRQALFSVAKLGDPLMYCGLPRTVSGYGAAAFVLSRLFFQLNPARYATGAVIITAFALLNLFPIPYMTHRGRRRMQRYVKLLAFGFLSSPVVAFVVAPAYVFDVLFFWMFGYAATAWIPIYPEEKRAFYARYREWAREVSRE
ncbi:MAG TPA: CDP-alcohol phosphatidyltransferase family protein [Polyangia bacterium]|nr:CDP-alcohol phosphatidyltransferase family protein [Polyangia bacterium]